MEKTILIMVLIASLVFLGIQLYERSQPNIIIDSAITTDGEYIYVDLSNQPLDCDWNDEVQEVINCVDVSEDKICKYNLDYTFAGECWDK